MFLVLGLFLVGLVVEENIRANHGYAGVVGQRAKGISLSCGGEYDPTQVVAFHHRAACGTLLQVTNPANGRSAYIPVVNTTVMYAASNGRVADLSPAAATLLGMDAKLSVPQAAVVRVMEGHWANLTRGLPVVASLLPPLPAALPTDAKETKAIALNMLGECAVCGVLGQVAVAQVTLNRFAEGFNGKTSIHGVVYDRNQFSWTRPEMAKPPHSGRTYDNAFAMAGAVLTDRVSGELLAVRYLVTYDATYYYAFDVIKTPRWGHRKGKLEVVPMSNVLEVELWHRFFREKLPAPTGETLLARR